MNNWISQLLNKLYDNLSEEQKDKLCTDLERQLRKQDEVFERQINNMKAKVHLSFWDEIKLLYWRYIR